MYHDIIQLINDGNFDLAEQRLQQEITAGGWHDETYILAANIYMETGRLEQAYDIISQGLKYNYQNYELYLLLGNYYKNININQAWLCYENSEFYCDNDNDREIILQFKKSLETSEAWNVKKTAIVILSYNSAPITKQCIASIRENNLSSSYELIIVDNHSTDGIQEWLYEQTDIKLICNAENKGFPYGCNQGIKIAEPDHDIFLLNNDTVVTPNAIFWLRMGLYAKDTVGAVGSITNYAENGQKIDQTFETVDEYIAFAQKNNTPMKNACEKKIFLIGFALMLKRSVLDEIGLLDIRFSPGTFEDNDLGLRMNSAGYQMYLCHNSFIFHYGHGNGENFRIWNPIILSNKDTLTAKWKFEMDYYTYARTELIELIEAPADEKISVLEVGCGLGVTLARIEYLWPRAEVKGIELVERLVNIASNYLDIIQGNAETMELPYDLKSFDYIILGDVLEHLYDPEKFLKRMIPYLKDDGAFLCSIPNFLHTSALLPLLQGKFDYEDNSILDRTHLRFFTLESILKMLKRCGLKMENLSGICTKTENIDFIEEISKLSIPDLATTEQFQVYQYIFKAKKLIP